MKKSIKKILTTLSACLSAAVLSCPAVVSFASSYVSTGTASSISPLRVIVCLGIGLILTFIIMSVMKSKLNSVHWQSSANDYMDESSFELTVALEIFKYDKVEKTARPQEKEE